jgi:hypothetical protein
MIEDLVQVKSGGLDWTIVNVEILQHVLVVYYFGCNRCDIDTRN